MLKKIISIFTVACALSGTLIAEEKNFPDPKRYESEIKRFEKKDARNMPEKGALLCIGSSSMRGWHKWIKEDLAPLTVIPRGFGGSNYNDVLYFADRIVIPYKPSKILIYEGDNDIAAGVSPEKTFKTFKKLVSKIRSELPDVEFYVMTAKPSYARLHLWKNMKKLNSMLKEECQKNDKMFFIDVATPMFNENGKLKKDIFLKDKLHMNRKGYEIWREAVREVIIPEKKD